MQIPILYRDEDLVVVNKPAGLLTHPDDGAGSDGADVASLLKRQLEQDYLGIHHRLDREVTGVLLFAARREANAGLARAFEQREAEKRYVAVVRGVPEASQGVVDAPLRRVRSGLWEAAPRSDRSASRARTFYRLLQTGPGGAYALLELQPETGRTHQLRVHLAHIGCPIAGDELYGARDAFPRLLLHAERLGLTHPVSGAPCSFAAPWPSVFERAKSGQRLPELELANRLGRGGLPVLRDRDRAGVDGLLELAAERRAPLEATPDETSAYRLLHGSGDGLPGIGLDRYGEALWLHDAGLASQKPVLSPMLRDALSRRWPRWPILRDRDAELSVREAGLLHLVRPGGPAWARLRLELRGVRLRVKARAAGLAVLCCLSGGGAFGLAAAAGGARRLVQIDPDAAALEALRRGLRANGLQPPQAEFLAEPAAEALRRLAEAGQRFDLVLLDVAAAWAGRGPRPTAGGDPVDLVALAGRTLVPGGWLVACVEDPGSRRRAFRDSLLGALGGPEAARVAGSYHAPDLDFPGPLLAELQPMALAFEVGPRGDSKTR